MVKMVELRPAAEEGRKYLQFLLGVVVSIILLSFLFLQYIYLHGRRFFIGSVVCYGK